MDVDNANDIVERPFADGEPGVGGDRRLVQQVFDRLQEVEGFHVRSRDHHLAGGEFAEPEGPLQDPPLQVIQHPRLMTLPHEDFEPLDRMHPVYVPRRSHADGTQDQVANAVEAPDQGLKEHYDDAHRASDAHECHLLGHLERDRFRTSSPRTTWSNVITKKAIATETVCESVTLSLTGSHAKQRLDQVRAAPVRRSSRGRGSRA